MGDGAVTLPQVLDSRDPANKYTEFLHDVFIYTRTIQYTILITNEGRRQKTKSL